MADENQAVDSATQSEVLPLRQVLLRHARDAFHSPETVRRQWRALDYLSEPDYDVACREYDAFAALLENLGAAVTWMEQGAQNPRGGSSILSRATTLLVTSFQFFRRYKIAP